LPDGGLESSKEDIAMNYFAGVSQVANANTDAILRNIILYNQQLIIRRQVSAGSAKTSIGKHTL